MNALAARFSLREQGRFLVLALLLFINALILESNEVVATTGFIGNVGVSQILWVWAADMAIVIVASGAYSLIVDHARRGWLAVRVFAGFSLVYIVLYAVFAMAAPDWLTYSLLMVINDQQWLLIPLLIWALANDMSTPAEAKTFFPRLGIAALIGALLGNALAALVARLTNQRSIELLLLNAALISLAALILAATLRKFRVEAHQSRPGDKVLDALREGLAFVREVPIYRYLTLAMILLGIGFNTVEFQFVTRVAHAYPDAAAMQAFYGAFKAASVIALFLMQGVVATWLLKHLGFKSVFAFMPGALLISVTTMLALPGLLAAAAANYISRVTLIGLDEPSRRAFQGLVPDERRGRVSAFMDGYLYPLGTILGCGVIGAVLLAVSRQLVTQRTGELIYLGLALACVLAAAVAIVYFRRTYDQSLLNWRLRRRQRKTEGVLSKLGF